MAKYMISEQRNRLNQIVEFHVDTLKVESILSKKRELGPHFPKFGILVLSYNTSGQIQNTISRIPISIKDAISEIFIFDNNSPDNSYQVALSLKESSPWKDKISVFKNERNVGYGGNQKVGYRYGLSKKMDWIIMLHGDGQYAPEYIPDLIFEALNGDYSVVYGSRMINRKDALAGGMPFYKFVGNQVLTRFENIILGTNLAEFHSGYRMYSSSFLKSVPFEENTDDYHFDTEIVIQCRALGQTIREIPIKTFYGDEVCNVNGMKYARDVCLAVLEYRLHQLHILRRGKYMVQFGEFYSRKRSPFSSHEIILNQVNPNGSILSYEDQNNLLFDSLKSINPNTKAIKSKNELPDKEEFSEIILLDIIPKVANDHEFLESLQKNLKEGGRVIFSTPNVALFVYRLSLLIGRFDYAQKGILDHRHLRFYTKSSVTRMVRKAGFSVEEIIPVSIPFELVFESIGKSMLLKSIDWIYYLFAKMFPKLFAYQFVVVAKPNSLFRKHDQH